MKNDFKNLVCQKLYRYSAQKKTWIDANSTVKSKEKMRFDFICRMKKVERLLSMFYICVLLFQISFLVILFLWFAFSSDQNNLCHDFSLIHSTLYNSTRVKTELNTKNCTYYNCWADKKFSLRHYTVCVYEDNQMSTTTCVPAEMRCEMRWHDHMNKKKKEKNRLRISLRMQHSIMYLFVFRYNVNNGLFYGITLCKLATSHKWWWYSWWNIVAVCAMVWRIAAQNLAMECHPIPIKCCIQFG